jgi:hypothetical protein
MSTFAVAAAPSWVGENTAGGCYEVQLSESPMPVGNDLLRAKRPRYLNKGAMSGNECNEPKF